MSKPEDQKPIRRMESKKYKTKFYAEYEQLKRNPLFNQALAEVIALEKKKGMIESIDIGFNLNFSTVFGEKMAVIGESEYLGNWDPSRALEMTWNEGNIWKCSVNIPNPPDHINYKYICIRGTLVRWENGDNRVVDVRKGERKGNKIQATVDDLWKR